MAEVAANVANSFSRAEPVASANAVNVAATGEDCGGAIASGPGPGPDGRPAWIGSFGR
jgi:hypothetical protein